jgi:hypothetical protein
LHWKLEPLSLELNWKRAEVLVVVSAGPEAMLVCGAVVSAGGVGCVGAVGGVVGAVGVDGVFGPSLAGGEVGGAGGPAGTLRGSRGLVPAATSAPSPKPSPSVSNLRGFVFVRRSSVALVNPSLSTSAWRLEVAARFTTVAERTFSGFCPAAIAVDGSAVRAISPSRKARRRQDAESVKGFFFIGPVSVGAVAPRPSTRRLDEARGPRVDEDPNMPFGYPGVHGLCVQTLK